MGRPRVPDGYQTPIRASGCLASLPMSSTYDATANAETRCQARATLDELMAWVGVDGLVAALESPGLLAALDQHTAAVRDALTTGDRQLDAPALAGYATSIIAAAHRMGRPLPEPDAERGPDVDWTRAGWHVLRLVGVCAVADEAGYL